MATAAQIEVNRRNAQKSCEPRTDEGKSRSRLNAPDHGCRASLLVLPTEDFREYERERIAWMIEPPPSWRARWESGVNWRSLTVNRPPMACRGTIRRKASACAGMS